MKKVLLTAGIIAALTAGAQAQQAISIGSGTGSLSFAKAYYNGGVDGDDATFDDGVAARTTMWNGAFSIFDGTTVYWMEGPGFSTHTSTPTDGTTANNGTGLTNTGMSFSGTTGLTADVSVTLSQPTVGDTAAATWTYAFSNSTASPINLVMLWFVDCDDYLGSNNYEDDYVVFATDVTGYTKQNSVGLIALGNSDGSGGVALNDGILMDATKTPTGFYGISDDLGSSYYWSSQNNFASGGSAADGPEALGTYTIDPAFNWTIQNDGDSNFASDSGKDSAAVMQVHLTIPATGSDTVSFIATWGINQNVAGGAFTADVNDWSLF